MLVDLVRWQRGPSRPVVDRGADCLSLFRISPKDHDDFDAVHAGFQGARRPSPGERARPRGGAGRRHLETAARGQSHRGAWQRRERLRRPSRRMGRRPKPRSPSRGATLAASPRRAPTSGLLGPSQPLAGPSSRGVTLEPAREPRRHRSGSMTRAATSSRAIPRGPSPFSAALDGGPRRGAHGMGAWLGSSNVGATLDEASRVTPSLDPTTGLPLAAGPRRRFFHAYINRPVVALLGSKSSSLPSTQQTQPPF